MGKRKTVSDYSKILSNHHNIPEIKVRKALMFMVRNLCRVVNDGEDVRIIGFGHVFFDKKKFISWLKKQKK